MNNPSNLLKVCRVISDLRYQSAANSSIITKDSIKRAALEHPFLSSLEVQEIDDLFEEAYPLVVNNKVFAPRVKGSKFWQLTQLFLNAVR